MDRKPVIAIAPDSFKGSIDALDAAEAIRDGILSVIPDAVCRLIPMADGGEGSLKTWADATGAETITRSVSGPMGERTDASFALQRQRKTAMLEMAQCSGLTLVPENRRDPLLAATFGLGELILAALDEGAEKLLVAIGGSATNDGGTGMLSALGARFLDAEGRELPPGGGALARLASIDLSNLDMRLGSVSIEVACDVTNPLCGENGASKIYAPQKGAKSKSEIEHLDKALGRLAAVAKNTPLLLGKADETFPGAGAAGGLGFGLMAFLGAKLCRGVDMIARGVDLKGKIAGADLVITGEGRMDGQTTNGKTPAGVAKAARALGVRTIAIAGCVREDYQVVHDIGIDAVVPVAHALFDPGDPSKGARERIFRAAAETARLLLCGGAIFN